MVRAGTTFDRLMEIVADRVGVGKSLEPWNITSGDVEEAHGGRAFARCLVGEIRRLRRAVAACTHRGFNPGEQIVQAARRIRRRRMGHRTIGLLPHLIKAVHRAGSIGVVRDLLGNLIGTVQRRCGVRDARVDAIIRQPGGTGGQNFCIAAIEPVLNHLQRSGGRSNRREWWRIGVAGR